MNDAVRRRAHLVDFATSCLWKSCFRGHADQFKTAPRLVLRVGANRRVNANGAEILPRAVGTAEPDVRGDHILFFDAADDAEYGFAVEVMDEARKGGAVAIAALTAALAAPAD